MKTYIEVEPGVELYVEDHGAGTLSFSYRDLLSRQRFSPGR